MVDRLVRFEQEIQSAAKDFSYPGTPNVAEAVMLRLKLQPQVPRLFARKFVWVMAIVVVLFSALMLVPPVRAAVLEWIQIGIVRIFPREPVPAPPPTSLPSVQPSVGIVPVMATPAPTLSIPPETPVPFSFLDLAGETTLAEAQTRVDFPILVPSYPKDLGLPDKVYLQEQGSPMLILIWLDPTNPKRVRLSLHTIAPGSWGIDKLRPKVIQQITVNGQPGVWTEGPYFLQLHNGDFEVVRLIAGHVLIWTQDKLTYRLETDLSLEEATRIAESLAPIPPTTP
jgi:hypothetical protein